MSEERVKGVPVNMEEMLICFADAVKDVLGNACGALQRDHSRSPERIEVMEKMTPSQKDFYTLIGMSVATLPKDLMNEDNMITLAKAVLERLEKLGHESVDIGQESDEERYVRPKVDKPDVMFG